MTDAITAVARQLAAFDKFEGETLPDVYRDRAREFLTGLADSGHWVAPWEASPEMMATIERHIKPRQWIVLREIVLKGQRAE